MKINLKPHSKEKYNLSLSMVRCMQTVADHLIKVEKVQVLIGSQAWQEAAIVADVGNRAQVPVISHAASLVSPKLTHVIDLETVVLHEIGHLLGLDHSSMEDTIMYPSIPSGVVKDLHDDDVRGIKALYNI
ncbi:hypothetical protein POM88_015487 [Heracleum sosnowskyi]|uniref:Peptidase M10 metallopeptidase domain-containing protein n=1 Tax=Heracleum sosnowskyi TaxID=360622 RepID=A0AAD8IK12_9APIA|nr:hypothetical protein POM88_015487 [Heracleum sosnowskyi]